MSHNDKFGEENNSKKLHVKNIKLIFLILNWY